MPVGKELKALAVADDSRVISVTTVVSLDACALVNQVLCGISGMVINWSKTIAIYSLVPGLRLPRLLGHVRVLQIGKVHKYLGVDHEAMGKTGASGRSW